MTEYRTPGVYRMPVKPAATGGLAVGVPAFLGYPMRGAANDPAQPLRQWSEYVAHFSGASIEAPDSRLAAAVRGFFENGGELCYVVALDGPPAAPRQALEAGLQKLDALDDVDLVAVPDLDRLQRNLLREPPREDFVRLQQQLVDACEHHGGRLALLDSRMDADVGSLLDDRGALTGTSAALYYPWLVVADPDGGPNRAVPPCGHVAGVYAATDRRVGVFKPPANVALQGVLDLKPAVSSADQDRLNPEGVNALRAFPGRGIRVWGARTISRDPMWRHVGVRRLFMTAGRWIERNLASVAFEPHNERLWARIGRELTAYFNSLFEAGALKGASAADAFVIKCDAETNPAASRDAGTVVTEIALAPSIPNEFVVVRISVATSGVTIAAVGA